MAPQEEELKKRVGRKLTKKRREGHQATIKMPENLDLGDDAEDDCTAPQGRQALMNQSLFGMIAAAGSQVDFNARFEPQSSDDEDALPHDVQSEIQPGKLRQSKTDKPERHRRKFSENKLLRSLPRLSTKSPKAKGKGKEASSPAAGSANMAPEEASDTEARDAPVMGRMLEAKAELASRPSFDVSTRANDPAEKLGRSSDTTSSSLANRLMEIFQFDSPEDVIEEYPCWLLKSVLLQGYMYITTKHICFYAYLPKKANVVVKSGHLAKRGQKNPKYNRYWFRLKGDVLSYYTDPSDLYFPSGNIDLRYGISAQTLEKEKGKDAAHFKIVTHQRQYHFRADSAPSAKEWVKALQKIIFRSHNDGDGVKISIPIANVMDIEDSQIVDFADTCKIRVIDNDETFAIDEYFFSFFSYGKEALNVLRILVEDTTARQIPEDVLSPQNDDHGSPRFSSSKRDSFHSSINSSVKRSASRDNRPAPPPLRTSTPVFEDSVKATLSPLLSASTAQSPRLSSDSGRPSMDMRRSMDLYKFGRRSIDVNRTNSFDHPRRTASTNRRSVSANRLAEYHATKESSSGSFVQSVDGGESSGPFPSMSEDTQASASQILRGSDVFRSPTIQRAASGSRKRDTEGTDSNRSTSKSPARKTAGEGRKGNLPHAFTTGNMEPTDRSEASGPTASLQTIVKAGAYPLQRAAAFTGYINKHTQRMSTLIASESMGYVEKVSGMWKGGRKHYDEPDPMLVDDEEAAVDEEQVAESKDRFREHFALPPSEQLQAAYFGYLHRVLPLYGKVYLSDRSFCFRSLLPGTRTKLILPLKDVENVSKEKGFRFGYHGLVIVIKGHEELFFEFGQADTRDDCAVMLLKNLETTRWLKEPGMMTVEEQEDAESAVAEHKALQEARQETHGGHELTLPRTVEDVRQDAPPILFDDPRASILNFKPTESLRITCLTIGSRGDVQPYIALCKGLLKEGHKPKIATHAEFKDWVESHGIAFAPVEGDPAELMRICVENGMFTYSFLKEASSKFRGWIDELCSSAWTACQDTDLLIESPSAMAGIHIAEALQIPYFRAFTMPWTRTRAYPHAFAVPEHKMGGAYNFITYVMFDNVFWKAIAGQINRWRKVELGLTRTNLDKLQPNKVPFLYNFSPSVVTPPLDYSDWIRVTGYWFLDEGTDWEPPKELTDFIAKARADGKKIVYIGFGSIVVSDSAALTKTIVQSVLKAGVRCILSKGWSDRLDKKGATEPEIELPEEILHIKSAPHDWLFKQIDAATHHGGAGTTGASLRAGLPTIIKPFFGDQFFFGSRVEDLGVGIHLKKLNVSVFSRALWEAVHSERMVTKARILGEQIRGEDGVGTAIQCIYRDLEYAKSLIKRKDGKPADEQVEESEESWTFIGDDNDPELVSRLYNWETMARSNSQSSPRTSVSRQASTGSTALPKRGRGVTGHSNSTIG